MELVTWFRLLLRWSWLPILTVAVATAVSFQATKDLPQQYEATARALVGPGLNSPNVSLETLRTSAMLVSTYRSLPTTRDVLEAAIRDLDLGTTPAELADRVDVTANPDTRLIQIRVRDTSPERSAAIAARLIGALADSGSQAGISTPAARVTIYDVPSKGRPLSSVTSQIVPLAALAALVLSVLVSLAVEYILQTRGARKVDSAADLTEVASIPCLGVVEAGPDAAGGSLDHPVYEGGLPPANAEAFRLCGARLWAVAQHLDAKSVLVWATSAEVDESVVSGYLAIALAERRLRVNLDDAPLLDGHDGAANPALFGAEARKHADGTDLTILSAPTAASMPDLLFLASRADAVLLVVPSGRTGRRDLDRVMADLKLTGTPVVGAVLVRPLRRKLLEGLRSRIPTIRFRPAPVAHSTGELVHRSETSSGSSGPRRSSGTSPTWATVDHADGVGGQR